MVSFALALVAIVGAGGGHVLQLVPVETVLILRVEAQCILMLVVGGVIVPQLIHDIEQKLPVSDHRCSRVRRQNLLRGHFADRDVLLVAGVVAAGEACFFKRGIQQRVRAGQQVLTGGINGADEEVDRCGSPLGRQGDVLLNSSGEVILFIAQIPAVEGIAGLGRFSGGLLYEEAPFNKLIARDGLAAVGVKGDFELVDLPLCRQGDVLCDGGIKVIHGGGLLVFAQIPEGKGIALARRVCRFLCIQTVFDHLRVNLAAAVGIEGDFVLVDLPLCRQGDISGNGGIFEVIGFVLVIQIPVREGKALERRVGRRDSLLAALDVLLIGRRRTAVSVEGNGIFLRHMYAALLLDPPAALVPDQRDRNELLIVSDMFQIRELLVELGHIEVWDIADVAKPVVPVLPRLADEVVFIVLAEQIVGVLMPLRFIYVALDLNSHFKLFQLVSRRGFGLAGDLDDRADLRQAVHRDEVPLPAVVLPRDVGLLLGVRVGVCGVDIRIRVERFDVLVFIKLDLVCPLAVGILPDIFAVHLDFRVSGGIRRAEIEILIIRIRMLIAAVLAMDENVIGELAHRGLGGLGGGVADDVDLRKRDIVVIPTLNAVLFTIAEGRVHIIVLTFCLAVVIVIGEILAEIRGDIKSHRALPCPRRMRDCVRTSRIAKILAVFILRVAHNSDRLLVEFVVLGLGDVRGGATLDFEGHFVACRDCPFAIRPAIDQREHLLEGFTLFKLMGAVSHGLAILIIRFLAILGNILVRLNCDIAGIASCFAAVYSSTDRVVDPVFACPQCNANLRMRSRLCRAFDIHAKFANLLDVFLRRGLGRVKLRGGGAGSVDDGLVPHVACLLDVPRAVHVLKRKARGLVCNSRMHFAAVIHNCACSVHIRIVLQFIRLDRDRAGVVYDRADIIGACNHVRIQRSVSRILCRAVNLNIRLVVDILRRRGGSLRLLQLPDGVEGGVLGDGD